MNKLFITSIIVILGLCYWQHNHSSKGHIIRTPDTSEWTLEKQRESGGEYQELLFFNQGESSPLFTIEFFGSVKGDYSIESLQSRVNHDLHDMGLVHLEDDYNTKLLPLITRLKSELLNSGAEVVKINLPMLDTRLLLTHKTNAQ
jgi:hypothetical protein